ncbi:MAG TPA: PQQ-binding-like beta-propeller repeat protein [Phycisphaerae bacterium]|nr:PQQ-binding-like beta-propeller repeat protein [Phycisphaerae bacterium]
MRKSLALQVALAVSFLAANRAAAQWQQWGGPGRDFKIQSADLADKWPESGPKVLWSRDLGDGYACIVSDGKRLYTTYHVEDAEKDVHDDVVVALNPADGTTVWEYRDPAPFEKGMLHDFGYGPRSTPLILGDRLYTVGATAMLTCLDTATGKKIWAVDLRKDHGATLLERGYGASPFPYKDKIILPIGGEGHAVVAINQADGSLAWKNQSFGPTYASPFIHKVDGEEHLIIFGDKAIHGLDPETGESKWSHEHAGGANISTPVAGDDGIFFFSSAYGVGSRAVQVSKADGKYKTEELFFNKKLKIHHGNAIRIGDYIYASSGDFGPAFFAAVNVKTGKFGWKKRGITKANSVYADDKLIILDEDGRLYLTKVSPKKIDIISKAQLLEKQAWTVPTLVGKTLYIRDLKKVVAVDLG